MAVKVTIGYAAPGAASFRATLDGQTVVFTGSPQEGRATVRVAAGRHALDWFLTGEPLSEYQVAVDDAPTVEGELPEGGSSSGSIRFNVPGRRIGTTTVIISVAVAAAVLAAILLAGRE